MSSALSVRSAMLPRANAIGNMTASAAITRRPPGRSSVSPSAECASPSRWPISCSAIDSRSKRSSAPAPRRDHGKIELKKMSDSTMSPVVVSISEGRGGERAIHVGTVLKAEHRRAVALRPAAPDVKPTNSDEICALATAVPGREGARHRLLELLRGHAADAAIGDEVADRHPRPLERHRPRADARAELQIRRRRAPARRRSAAARSTDASARLIVRRPSAPSRPAPCARTHRAAAAGARRAPRVTVCGASPLAISTGGDDHALPASRIDPDAEDALVQAEDVRDGRARRRAGTTRPLRRGWNTGAPTITFL